MSSLRSPKALAEWLELDSPRRPRRWRRWWWATTLGAVAASAGVVAWALADRTALQAGPVSSAHAMFNHDCSLCHTGEQRTFHRLWRLDPGVRSVPDSACTQCHSGAVHHPTEVGERRCASCHKEHRGRHALVRVDDAHCTACHADLRRNDGRETPYSRHVTAFAPGKHPDYKLFATGAPADPGTVRFNHAAHLPRRPAGQPKGVLALDPRQFEKQWWQVIEQGGRPARDVDKKGKSYRELSCQDCHQPDAAGRYMQPISYDKHCKSCHPLGVQLVGDWGEGRLDELAYPFSILPAPHPSPGQTPEVVRGAVRDRLARFFINLGDGDKKAFLSATDLGGPGRPVPGARLPAPLPEREYEWVNRQQREVERLLFEGTGGCRYCHAPLPRADQRPDAVPEFCPSNIPARWHQHAAFSHKSHRMLDCAECHGEVATSTKTSDVWLPRIDTCLKCHSTTEKKARSGCVECHTYHDPVRRHDFRGARTIADALRR